MTRPRKPDRKMTMQCERCLAKALPEIRFCKDCKKAFIKEMKESGYLQKVTYGHVGISRPAEAREKTYETKHGTGH